MGFFISGAKLPLYAYRRVDRTADEDALVGFEEEDAPLTFLDMLVLGEVNGSLMSDNSANVLIF